MTIFVDADACPVVEHTIRLGRAHGVPVVLLCDTAHRIEREGAQTVVVSQGADSVDLALANRIGPGDIAATQDDGLAALCLARGAAALSQNGLVYTGENIDALLLARHTARKIRGAGGRLKGPAKRTRAQDEAFERALAALLSP